MDVARWGKYALGIVGLLLICSGYWFWKRPDTRTPSGYHAVFLQNNLVVIGRLSGYGSGYPVLTDVYYVRQNVNPETKAVSNVLIRRGNEWHGPDRMIVNGEHIIFVEPVAKGSRVEQLIQEMKPPAPAASNP